METQENIAIMGGTFNPIHYAHLLCAEQVREGLGYDKILFMPSARPPHKTATHIAAPEHRYQMVCLATAENPRFDVSRMEVERAGPSYTIQTLKDLQTHYYGDAAKIGWIIGADSLIEYQLWKDFDEVLARCEMIATTRPNYELTRVPPAIRNRVTTFRITGVDISATDIRERIAQGRSIRYLVPEPVREYICHHKLYQ